MHRSSWVPAAVLAFGLAACGGAGDQRAGRPSATPTPDRTEASWQSCRAPRAGFAVDFPADWHTNPGTVDERCHWFDPARIRLKPATDVVGVAIHLRMVDAELATHVERVVDSPVHDVLDRDERGVAGRRAVVLETRATGRGLLREGVRTYTYHLGVRDRVLVASATESDAGDGVPYEDVKDVLDRMVASLEFGAASTDCSAAGLSRVPEPQRGLPAPVASTRIAIVSAATACDYGRLAEIAGRGRRPFTASFGGVDDVAAYWRRLEADGGEPLRFLVALLDRPHRRTEVQGSVRWVWPSAFGYERWSDVPEEDRQALRPLYGDRDFRGFEQFGSYVGYRVGIAGDGEWLFFVSGD